MLKIANYTLSGIPYTDPPASTGDGKMSLILASQGFAPGERVGRTISVVSLDVQWSVEHTTVASSAEDQNTIRVIFVEDRAPLGYHVRDYPAAFDITPGNAQLSHVKVDVQPPLFTVLADELHVVRTQNATKSRVSGRKHFDFPDPLVCIFGDDPFINFPNNRQLAVLFVLQKFDPLGSDVFNINVQMTYFDH